MLPDEASTGSQRRRNVTGEGDIHVEVVYALPERQYIRALLRPNDSTVLQAIVASGLPQLRTDIDLQHNKVGIYGRLVKLSDLVNEGDRIEIYRPLIADPKELRRRRADKSKK
ncbi:hypothetical protein Rin_00002630 [Candidatus Regiella insecticola 5.15]|uniref:UPF0125 protein Rin_00002630 n=1 Tax=Candidatus Regiella insecticola 5.15 TaxID=1005043 RepID=G2GWX6_9ENTR|nr:RnfH family protein [Candidatus Regiella insecticola]EGY29760.1 hypothetical protein Rin_00002630 [Candidatus Regiella insecticola 5.15]